MGGDCPDDPTKRAMAIPVRSVNVTGSPTDSPGSDEMLTVNAQGRLMFHKRGHLQVSLRCNDRGTIDGLRDTLEDFATATARYGPGHAREYESVVGDLLFGIQRLEGLERIIPHSTTDEQKPVSAWVKIGAMVKKTWPEMHPDGDTERFLRRLRQAGHLNDANITKAKDAEQALQNYDAINIDSTSTRRFHDAVCSNWLLAVMYHISNDPSGFLKEDHVSRCRPGTFYIQGCAQQLLDDLSVFPSLAWMDGVALSITQTLLETKNADTYKDYLAMFVPLPIVLLQNPLFYSALEDDFELLLSVKNAITAVARARCFELFFLQLRGETYQLRAKYYKSLIETEYPDTNFNLVHFNAYGTFGWALTSMKDEFSQLIGAIDSKASQAVGRQAWLEALEEIPLVASKAEREVWTKYQDWMAGIPQLALYHYKGLKDKKVEPGELWKLHNTRARGEGKFTMSYFRFSQTKVVRLWLEDMQAVLLPNTPEHPNDNAADLLRRNNEVVTWSLPQEDVEMDDIETSGTPMPNSFTLAYRQRDENKKRKVG